MSAIMKQYKAEAMEAKRQQLTEAAKDGGHGARWINNRMQKRSAEIDAAAAAGEIESIDIGVEWVKSRTWGSNPTATARIRTTAGYASYKGHASGCGYDKESAAIADALNQSPAMVKALIIASDGGKLTRGNGFPYGARVGTWGANLSGGVGVESYRTLFEYMGYEWDRVASGKSFDAYTIRKK